MPANNFASIQQDTSSTGLHSKFCPSDTIAAFALVPNIVNAFLNVAFAIATSFSNLVVLLAMRRVTSIRLPTKLLFCSLVLTDLGAGLVVQPQLTALILTTISDSYAPGLAPSVYVTASFLCSASLFTMLGISLDRCALLYIYSYQQVITPRSVLAYLASTRSLSLIMATSYVWNRLLYHVYSMFGIFNAFFTVSMTYVIIYRSLRGRHGNQVEPQPAESGDPDQQQVRAAVTAMNRKTSSTVLWIHMIFIICYSPYISTYAYIAVNGCTPVLQCIHEYCYTLVLVNSFINPFVYCIRLRQVRTEVKNQLWGIFFCFDGY